MEDYKSNEEQLNHDSSSPSVANHRFSQDEDTFKQPIKIQQQIKGMKVPMIKRGQQRRLDARLRRINQASIYGEGI